MAHELKLKLVSKESMTTCMTSDFYSMFVDKVPNHNQLSLREISIKILEVWINGNKPDPKSLRSFTRAIYITSLCKFYVPIAVVGMSYCHMKESGILSYILCLH